MYSSCTVVEIYIINKSTLVLATNEFMGVGREPEDPGERSSQIVSVTGNCGRGRNHFTWFGVTPRIQTSSQGKTGRVSACETAFQMLSSFAVTHYTATLIYPPPSPTNFIQATDSPAMRSVLLKLLSAPKNHSPDSCSAKGCRTPQGLHPGPDGGSPQQTCNQLRRGEGSYQ